MMPASLRKAFAWLVSGLLSFYVLWLVIANNAVISLNLLFTQTPELNAGLVVCIAFLAGLVVGTTLATAWCRLRRPN